MSQVKECLQRSYECSKVLNAIPKACLQKVEKKNCKFERVKTCQTLKNRFKYVQPCRRELCKPTSQSTVSKTPFTDDTVYTHSYYEHDVCENRSKPIVHKDHLVMAGKFQDKTSQRMSYPVQCISTVQKVMPKDSCLGLGGPMRLTTTQQHDYYVPCAGNGFERGKKFVRPDNLVVDSDCPMAKLTTSYCSYQPVCVKRENNFKPDKCYRAPMEKMDLNTTHRSSYKLIGPQEKIRTPWAEKLDYCKPKNAMEYCTVYKYSFKEPGAYMYKDNCGDTVGHLMADSNLVMQANAGNPLGDVASTSEETLSTASLTRFCQYVFYNHTKLENGPRDIGKEPKDCLKNEQNEQTLPVFYKATAGLGQQQLVLGLITIYQTYLTTNMNEENSINSFCSDFTEKKCTSQATVQ